MRSHEETLQEDVQPRTSIQTNLVDFKSGSVVNGLLAAVSTVVVVHKNTKKTFKTFKIYLTNDLFILKVLIACIAYSHKMQSTSLVGWEVAQNKYMFQNLIHKKY